MSLLDVYHKSKNERKPSPDKVMLTSRDQNKSRFTLRSYYKNTSGY